MCSICGIASEDPEPSHLNDLLLMLRATRHRGPDSCGAWTGAARACAPTPDALEAESEGLPLGRVLLGQSRLAITGGLDATQPFVSADGRMAFAHNGEFYNHRELRAMLGDDAPEEGSSDSEVLARLVERAYEGDLAKAVKRVLLLADGMYALAASDGETLVLARDPIGKKPLYYLEGPPFAFASERKALLPLARRSGAVVRRLPPGSMLTVRAGGAPVVEPVETLPVPPVDVVDAGDAVRLYEDALAESVRRRTRGLKRAAILFSGGVDSVLVARLLQNAGVEVTGYTMGMDGSGDVDASEAVARELGIPLRVARVDEDTLERELPDILRAIEIGGPLQVEVAIPMWFCARMAHEDGHRVVFTGQGADELFAGYDWYRGVVERQGHVELHARLWEDVRMLAKDTLEREDRITMAHSLELRAPFLDQDLVRASMRIAPHLKCEGPDDLLRKRPHREVALRAGVPESIALREKIPAQDGASTCALLEALARRRVPEGATAEAFADFGSNYRYRDTLGAYAAPEVHALLAAVVKEHGLLVVDERHELRVPPEEPGVRLVPSGPAVARLPKA